MSEHTEHVGDRGDVSAADRLVDPDDPSTLLSEGLSPKAVRSAVKAPCPMSVGEHVSQASGSGDVPATDRLIGCSMSTCESRTISEQLRDQAKTRPRQPICIPLPAKSVVAESLRLLKYVSKVAWYPGRPLASGHP